MRETTRAKRCDWCSHEIAAHEERVNIRASGLVGGWAALHARCNAERNDAMIAAFQKAFGLRPQKKRDRPDTARDGRTEDVSDA